MGMSPKTLVCRIQDREGRGPYKPGFSHRWSERVNGADPIYIAFPHVVADINLAIGLNGCGAAGCAFRSIEQADKWFSPSEVLTLATLGYGLVWMLADEVLAENDDQLVIYSRKPLADAVIHRGWSVPEAA